MQTVDAPNKGFEQRRRQDVRFIDVPGLNNDVWGRLYLPANYEEGRRYPLVITQYVSSPGFSIAHGEEIPMPMMTEKGIAVFEMHSVGLNYIGGASDSLDNEIDRVEQPLLGMQKIVRKLSEEGIVDPKRVGVIGLSYGAEIAAYAAWNWKGLAAVSAATGSWDPSLLYLGGVTYFDHLKSRGFPLLDSGKDIEEWRRLSLGANARIDLPAILIQSPDEEQTFTSPTWTQLRLKGAPIAWYEYPNEGHVKRGPANIWWVFRRNLDWFRFWLQGYEDPDPLFVDQYTHWRKLRAHQCENLTGEHTPWYCSSENQNE